MSLVGVEAVVSHGCRFGLSVAANGRLSKKPTIWMSNALCILAELDKKRKCTVPHARLEGGLARAAQAYPPRLVDAMLRGLGRQLQLGGSENFAGAAGDDLDPDMGMPESLTQPGGDPLAEATAGLNDDESIDEAVGDISREAKG